MVSAKLLFSLLATTTSVAVAKQDLKQAAARTIPGAYIFEFEDDAGSSDFVAMAEVEGSTRMKLDYELFRGVSVQLNDLDTAEERARTLSSHPGVKKMWPVRTYPLPDELVWAGTPETTASKVLQKRQAGGNQTTSYAPHAMTQVDLLQKEGFTGTGIRIAVIDTGIDYTHPVLGGCFGPGCLVAFGTDFVGDDFNGQNTPVPDPDPMDCGGHGTHVAGIVAASPDNDYGFLGAAPDAVLGAYRVFGCGGETPTDVLIAAYNQAYEDGADIITASIGGPSGWSEDPWSVAVQRIIEKGVPCPLAAGNSGSEGLFYTSTAANGVGVTSVASFDNIRTPVLLYVSEYRADGGEDEDFGFSPSSPDAWEGVSLPLWALNYDPTVLDDACDPFPEDTPDLSGYIVLIRRGTCTFVIKAQNAANAGAKYILIYNNVAGTVSFSVVEVEGILAGAAVLAEVGEEWISLLASGAEVIVDMYVPETDSPTTIADDANLVSGGAVSTYSSWGPNNDMANVPAFGAPGANILSTYPLALGGYAVLSGTSMATPLIAGALALLAEARGTFDPALLNRVLSNTANAQLFNDGFSFFDFLAPVPQQGAGLIQLRNAARTTTTLEPYNLSFNDTAHAAATLNFTLSNLGDEEITYDIGHVPTASFYTLVEGSIYPDQFPNEASPETASLSFSEDKVTVAPGESVIVEVVPSAPQGLDEARLPVWSGYVSVNGSDGSALTVPYQGLSGSLRDAVVLAPDDAWIAHLDSALPYPVAENASFVLPVPGTATAESLDVVGLIANLALGSRKVDIEIIAASNGTSLGQPIGWPGQGLWRPRALQAWGWDGGLSDGTYAPAGRYSALVRALRIFGDEENEEDWDETETGVIAISYASA